MLAPRKHTELLVLLEKGAEPGTIKVSSVWPKAKKKAQVRVYSWNGSKWDYIGTLGATKGKSAGVAEAFLKKAGVNVSDFPSGHKWTHFIDPKGKTTTKVPKAATGAQAGAQAPAGAQKAPEDAEAKKAAQLKKQQKEKEAQQQKADLEHEFIFDMMQNAGWNSPTATDSEEEWQAAFGDDWYGSYAIAKDMLNYAKEKKMLPGMGGITPGTPEQGQHMYGGDFVQSLLDQDWGIKEIEDMYGKDWTTKVNAIAKALYKNPPATAPEIQSSPTEPSASVKKKMAGYKTMYNAIADVYGGDLDAMTAADSVELSTTYGPNWAQDYKLGKTMANFASDSGSWATIFKKAADHPTFAATLASMYGDDWKEKAAEIHKQLTGIDAPIIEPALKEPEATPTPPAPAPPPKVADSPVVAKPKKQPKIDIPVPAEADYQPPPGGTPAADLPIPPPSKLKLKGSGQFLGGAGQKQIYTDEQGNEFLFKLATKKGAGKKADPMRAFVQASFSAIAKRIRPAHPEIQVTKLGGKVGAIYPFLPSAAKTDLSGQTPADLSPSERWDVAEEHVVDWLMSQHDSHPGNFLRTAEGRIIGVDKEQGFKYFGDDRLDVDYHPNSKYGEQEPFYNTFWRDWSKGKFDFDPQKLGSTIDKAMAIPGKEYRAALEGYAASRFPGDSIAQAGFVQKAINRKNTLKRDFEKFLTGLHEKKHGVAGSFTFDKGWIQEGEADKPYVKKIKHPAKTETAAEKLSGLGGTSKTVPHKTDPSKLTVKTTQSEADLKKLFKDLGFGDVPVKVGSNYKMAFVDKAAWDSASITTPAWEEEKTIYPEAKSIAAHSGTASYLPEVQPPTRATPNSSFLGEIKKDTQLGWMGKRVTLDGPAVEQQVARVVRKKDAKGEYYEVHFKLRQPVHGKITGGSSTTYQYQSGSYDEKTDTQTDTGSTIGVDAKRWTTGDGEVHLVTGSSYGSDGFAFKGSVFAKVRTGPENIQSALKEMLDSMQPGLAKQVLRDPTEEEQEVVRLSAALKEYAPKVADQLDKDEAAGKVERTPALLRSKLKGKLKKSDIDSLGQIEVLPNFSAVVQPGRWKTLGGGSEDDPVPRFLMWEVSTPEKVVNMFKGNGLASIHDRALQGLPTFGASVHEDIRTGCADNMTLRVATKGHDYSSANMGWGSIRMIVAPDELDRLDTVFHFGDKYGCVNPDHGSYGSAYRGRSTMDAAMKKLSKGTKGEIVVRRGISKKKILRVGTDNEQVRRSVIQAFKKEGIHEVNGVPIEDYVVVSGSVGDVYKKYVKPAGF